MKFHVDALHSFKVMLRTKKGTDGRTTLRLPPLVNKVSNKTHYLAKTIDFTRACRTQNVIGTYLSHLTVLNSMHQRR